MEYTVQKLSKLANISSRTIRYYDEMGILKPARINSSGYRIYGSKEIDTLQQILFYKELGLSLDQIKEIITSPYFDPTDALREHHVKLLEQKKQLNLLIQNVEKTIAYKEGRITMKDQEKFEGFKQQLIDDNEMKYGNEVREKYGNQVVNESNQKIKGMTSDQYVKFEQLGQAIIDTLLQAYPSQDPASDLAQQAADLHKKWLGFTWKHYSKEAHQGLAQMYVDDERFTAYYDQYQKGLAQFLRDSIFIYTSNY